jgi:paired small multidrug resistance pump
MSMNITIDWTVIVGLAGMIITLLAYFLLQAQKLHGNGLVYQLMNAVGALGVALSLLFGTFNLPAFLLEVIWLVISIYGIVVARRIRVQ